MSIINKMLQELEQRHADDPVAGELPGQLRAVPRERSSHAGWLAAAILAVLLVGLLVWLWLRPAPVAKPASAMHLALKIAPTIPAPQPVAPVEAAAPEPAQPEAGALPSTPNPATKENAGNEKNAVSEVVVDSKANKVNVVQPPSADIPVAKPVQQTKVAPLDYAQPKMKNQPPSQQVVAGNAPASRQVAAVPDAPLMLDKQVRALTPQQRAENDYRRATTLAEQGRAADAIAMLEQVLQDAPAHAGARQTLIALLLKNKRQDDALRRAREGLDLDVKQPGFAMILARLQVEKGEQKAAIATLQRTLPYTLDRPDYRAFLAALLQREGRHKEAIEQYLLAVSMAPQNGVWWMGLGISMQADNRPEEARESFSRARETNTLSPELQAFVEQKLKQLGH